MSHRSANSSGHSRSARAPGHRGRIYIFLLVSLAVFLGGIVLWQRPPSDFAARVKLRHRSGDVEIPVNTLAGTIASPEAVREVVSGLGRPNSARDLEVVRSKLLVDAHPASRPGEADIELWYVASSGDQAKLVAERLAERFVNTLADAAKAGSLCGKCDEETTHVHAASTQLRQAKDELNTFLKKHAEEFAVAIPATKPTTAKAPQVAMSLSDASKPVEMPAKAAAETPAAERLNPEWVDLDDRLQVLRAARDELLTKRTEAHPEVRDLEWQIEKLQAEHALIRRTIASRDGRAVDVHVADDDSTADSPSAAVGLEESRSDSVVAAPSPSPDLQLRRRKELEAAVATAEQQLQGAQQHLQKAQSQHRHPVFASAQIVEPAWIVSRRGGGVSRAGMAFAAVLAIVVGFMATWRSQVLAQPAQLISCAQIESLGIPVVAAISTGDGPSLPQPLSLNPTWIRWLMFACELALASIALTMLLLALAEWQVAAGLLRDPLSTFSEAVDRLGS